MNVKNVGKSTRIGKRTQCCECGFELGGSFVGKPPQPKCPASVKIWSYPDDDRNFAFVSETEALCHTNKYLQLQINCKSSAVNILKQAYRNLFI